MKNTILSLVVLALGVGAAWLIVARTSDSAQAADDHDHDHAAGEADHHMEVGEARGPHGGRLVTEGDFAVELAIFERGVPPEFRAWFTRGGQPLAPDQVELSVQLHRPGAVVDHYAFKPEGEFARGQSEVYEPHSFDYVIDAKHAGKTYHWEFDAPEMQTTISSASAERAGVVTAVAAPATLPEVLTVYGEVKPNGDRIARAVTRFTGFVSESRKSLGDTVTAGEVVAVVESNETLVTFDVKAPIAGTIVERLVAGGETITEGQTLYVIADTSDVWIDLAIPRREQARVHVGQSVRLRADDGGEPAEASIASLLPAGAAQSQSLLARVELSSADGRWRPGWFVSADIMVAKHDVPVAVEEGALQTLFDFTVVFSQHGELYQARPLELGRRGGGYVEVLKGLSAGESYVTENSFLIKADILKSGATHDH